MTTKEKAEKLFFKFSDCGDTPDAYAINHAIIAVEEILELDVAWQDKQVVDKYSKTYTPDQCKEYWQQVKQHLEEMI